MKGPNINYSETFGFSCRKKLWGFIDEVVTPNRKGGSNLFAIKENNKIVILDGNPMDIEFQEKIKSRFKSVMGCSIKSIKCDITTISVFAEENDIRDLLYDAMEEFSNTLIFVSEEEPVSNAYAEGVFKVVVNGVNAGKMKQSVLAMALLNDRTSEDGIIHQNWIVRWFVE